MDCVLVARNAKMNTAKKTFKIITENIILNIMYIKADSSYPKSKKKKTEEFIMKIIKKKLIYKAKEYYQNNKDQALKYGKNYYKDNKEKIIESSKLYYYKNKDRLIEYSKMYYKENSEYFLEYRKQYYENNKEIYSQYGQQYYCLNKEYYKKYQKKWRNENNEKCRILSEKRRSLEQGLPSTLTVEQWEQIKSDFNNKCAYCGQTEKRAFRKAWTASTSRTFYCFKQRWRIHTQ